MFMKICLSYTNSEDTTLSYKDALIYASGLVTLNAFSIVFTSQIGSKGFHYGMKVRVAVCSLIYRKV